MEEKKKTLVVLDEHKGIVYTRYILAIINFIAILSGTIVTLYLVLRKGISDEMLFCIYGLIVINVVQIALCATDFILKCFYGIYARALTIIIYITGALWLLVLVCEIGVGYVTEGFLRTDLFIIAVAQTVVALLAYIIWPMLDRKALNALIKKNTRTDSAKRKTTAKYFIRAYVMLCILIIVSQAAVMLAYKMPPKAYDIFADERALDYELSEDGTGYIVTGVYRGTSSNINVPAYYNDKPVIGIASGAIKDEGLFDSNKIDSITFGTLTKDSNGNEKLVSNLQYIEKGAIVNDQITELVLPASINKLGVNAVSSTSLKTLRYESKANFDTSYFACAGINTIVMSGEDVGHIVSLAGLNNNVLIQVSKDIYDQYRQENEYYAKSFRPILDDMEFCIDFYTGCDDYYIDSIIATGTTLQLNYSDLYNEKLTGIAPSVDTLAYIRNNAEVGTPGAKEGYAFRGWYYDANFTQECVFKEDQPTLFNGNASLYAKWVIEYSAEMDWGTYKPDNAVDKVYWTDADNTKLPDYKKVRQGYSEGVIWRVEGSDKIVTDMRGFSRNLELYATWLLDAPAINIDLGNYDNEIFTVTGNEVVFDFDETRALSLKAEKTHPLNELSVNGQKTYYMYEWKVNNKLYSSDDKLTIKDVTQTGIYDLKVTIYSPYGETAYSTASLDVTVNKKALDIGDATIASYSGVYNGNIQSTVYNGTLPKGIKVTYYYLDGDTVLSSGAAGSSGVTNAGEYVLRALYEKSSATEAANYGTKEQEVDFVITPQPIRFIKWQGSWSGSENTTTYSGQDHSIFMIFDGVISGEQVVLTYRNNTAKDAGTYYAEVTGIKNTNYTLKGITSDNLKCEWEIAPKEVSVSKWQLDSVDITSYSVTYDKQEHSVSAVITGIIPGDAVRFIYDMNSAVVAGNYTSQIIGVSDSNYYFDINKENTLKSLDWSISQRVINVRFSQISENSYDGQYKTVNAYVGGFVADDLKNINTDCFDHTYERMNVVGGIISDSEYRISYNVMNAGTYSIMFNGTLLRNDTIKNYKLNPNSCSFVIKKKELDCNIESYVYNGETQDLAIVISGFVGDDAATVAFGQFETTAIKGAVSGDTYVLYWQGKDADNYAASITSIENDNYRLREECNSTIAIKQKKLNIAQFYIADSSGNSYFNQKVKYKGEFYTVRVQVGGVAAGEEVQLTLTGNVQEKNVNATYSVSLSLDAAEYPNYSLSDENNIFNWEIEPVYLDFGWTFDGVFYDVSSQTPEFTYKGDYIGLAPVYDVMNNNDVIDLTYSVDSSLTGKDAKEYSVTVESTGNTNYLVGANASFKWIISAKEVRVLWNNPFDQLIYSGQYQGPSFELEGLIESDIQSNGLSAIVKGYSNGYDVKTIEFDITSTDAAYSLTLANGFAVSVGEYRANITSIFKEGLPDRNYNISDSSQCSFEIIPKTVILSDEWLVKKGATGTEETYSVKEPLIYNKDKFTMSRIMSGTVTHLEADVTLSLKYSGNVQSEAGTYTAMIIGITGTGAENYALPDTGLECSWTIVPKTLTIMWDDNNSWVYDGSLKTYAATYLTNASDDLDGKVYNGDSVALLYDEQGTSHINAGNYISRVSGLDNANYSIAADNPARSAQWSIEPRAVAFNWSYSDTIYNGSNQYPTASYNYNGDNLEVIYEYPESGACNVGVYTISVKSLGEWSNYTLEGAENITHEYSITARPIEIEWYIESGKNLSSDMEYDGVEYTLKARIVNLCDKTAPALEYSGNVFKNAGDYTARVIGVNDSNYKLNDVVAANSYEYTVRKRTIALEWKWDQNGSYTEFVYDGNLHGVYASVSNLCGNDVVQNISYSGANESSSVGSNDISVAGVIFATGSDNYDFSDTINKTARLKINAQPVAIAWGADNLEYNGQLQARSVTVKGQNDAKNVDFTVVGSYKDCGTYTINVILNDSNYTLTGATGAAQTNMTIVPRIVELSWNNKSSVYVPGASVSAEAQIINVCSGDNVTVSGYKYSLKSPDLEFEGNSVTEVGEYVVKAVRLDNANYTLEGCLLKDSGSIIINPQQAIVKWDGGDEREFIMPYNGTNQVLEYSVFASDGISPLDSSLYFVTITKEGVPVEASAVIESGEYLYQLTFASKNYTAKYESALSVKQIIEPVSVQISWQTITDTEYDGNVKEWSAQIDNKVNTYDDVALIFEITKDGEKCDEVRDAGEYVIRISALSGTGAHNYSIDKAFDLTYEFTITDEQTI